MGGYISTYMRSTPAVDLNDVSGNTVQAPIEASSDTVATPPPTPDEQQTTVETKQEDPAPVLVPLPLPSSPLPPVEDEHTTSEKTVMVDPLPVHQKMDINRNNRKRGRK